MIVERLFTFRLWHIENKVLFNYQLIFLFYGLLTVVYAVVNAILMPVSPMEAKYLTKRKKNELWLLNSCQQTIWE